MKTYEVITHVREEMVDITALVSQTVTESGLNSGLAFCFVPHTTAGITINENADPDVTRDILYKLQKEIPRHDAYSHTEGNSDAHLKASLMGFSLAVLFEDKKLVLVRWQAIYFCEFDGPRRRHLIIRTVSGD
ncbi:MAG: secondary thiamine-phosphate synthase enzyme YjbQ [candidate division Zixibacteria bacterium]|nr:secondary thiamine-phosphate synthase enzyme YjbQ [candidate division Zixibacteria bacterium]MDD5424864.1 secondary thiamine-phosphate synthase enzyme YjbQ [candidate division Zixibacteria bacterium]